MEHKVQSLPLSSLRYLWEHPDNPHPIKSYSDRFNFLVTMERLMFMRNWKSFSSIEKKLDEILISLTETRELNYPLLVRDNLPLPLYYVQVGMQRLACMRAISIRDYVPFLYVPAIVIDKEDSWDDRIKERYYQKKSI